MDATASARLMRQAGLCGRQKRRYRVRTTAQPSRPAHCAQSLALAPRATAPNQLWVADVTYVQTQEGWLFLAAILDLYSRKIWSVGG